MTGVFMLKRYLQWVVKDLPACQCLISFKGRGGGNGIVSKATLFSFQFNSRWVAGVDVMIGSVQLKWDLY